MSELYLVYLNFLYVLAMLSPVLIMFFVLYLFSQIINA